MSNVVRETLVAAESPRLITALGPVLVRNIDHLALNKLALQLAAVGLDRRLAWLVDNTLAAIRQELRDSPSPSWRHLYRRADVVLDRFLGFAKTARRYSGDTELALDLLDADIRSKKTIGDMVASSSRISRHWGIVTSLQPEDFVEALRAARAT